MSHEVEEARRLLESADPHYVSEIIQVVMDLHKAISDIALQLDRIKSNRNIRNRDFTLTSIPELPEDIIKDERASVQVLADAYNEHREVYIQLLDLQLMQIPTAPAEEDPEEPTEELD